MRNLAIVKKLRPNPKSPVEMRYVQKKRDLLSITAAFNSILKAPLLAPTG